MTKDSWWTVVLTDGRASSFNQDALTRAITNIQLSTASCCSLAGLAADCSACPADFQVRTQSSVTGHQERSEPQGASSEFTAKSQVIRVDLSRKFRGRAVLAVRSEPSKRF